MLDKQITNAYAAIEIAIGRDKLHAQFKINAQLPTPQPSDQRVDRASVFGSVDSKFDSDLRQTNDLKIGIQFPCLMLRDSVELAGKFACCAIGKGT